MDEHAAMRRAFELAARGWGRVRPNPLVGAVVVRDGAVIAEGWHAEYGQAHAERMALDAAGPGARGATLVVTLEPCAHLGKQPPCVDRILEAGIARVVAALGDPNPAAAGGAARLRAAGVDVELGVLAEQAAAQNAAFLSALRQRERPWVALKLAASLDGRIADAAGDARWISGEAARAWVHWLRAGFDAVAIGGQTARRDDPVLTVRGTVTPRVPPLRVVFSRSAALPLEGRLVRTADEEPVIVVAGRDARPERVGALEGRGITVLRAADLGEGLRQLRGRGVQSLLVEGGGRLGGALLAAGLVDRFYRVESPIWLGDGGAPMVYGIPDTPIGAVRRWRLVERVALGDDTALVFDGN